MNESENRKAISQQWKWGNHINKAFDLMVRRWFIQGQADYRAGNPTPEDMNRTQANSWLMGWQADAAIDKLGLILAPLGKSNILEPSE